MIRIQSTTVAILALLTVASSLDAQRRRTFSRSSRPSTHSKNHDSVKQAFQPAIVAARKSTVVVRCDDKQVALGTIVTGEGHIVTKTSELKDGTITCELHDGTKLDAERLGEHYDNDLVMLKVDSPGLTPVQWSKNLGAKIGSWVAVPGKQDLPLAVGIMSAQVHDRDTSKFRRRMRSSRSRRSSNASSRRNDRRGPISRQEAYWGPLSNVRIGFEDVIQHDSVIRPNQCGGPLCNLDGEVIGINISRVTRIETLALTGAVVRRMLQKLKDPKYKGRKSAAKPAAKAPAKQPDQPKKNAQPPKKKPVKIK